MPAGIARKSRRPGVTAAGSHGISRLRSGMSRGASFFPSIFGVIRALSTKEPRFGRGLGIATRMVCREAVRLSL